MNVSSLKHSWHSLSKPVRVAICTAALLLIAALVCRIVLREQRIHLADTQVIYVPEGSTYERLTDSIDAHGCRHNKKLFDKLARLRGLPSHVRPGRYELTHGMGVVHVIQKFYAGNQDPIDVTINKHRTKESLTDYLGTKLEMDGDSLLVLMNDSSVAKDYGYTVESFIGMFVQNTYEVYWTITPRELLDRMQKESRRFWTTVRKGQCRDVGLDENGVLTLASIIEEETNENDEKPLMASVYLNRLHSSMPLQADPTVRFAVGDFGMKRIGGSMMSVNSPYNTYRHPGLPPGPICIPSVQSIDAVLSGVKSDYLYFCAKEDFSGHHNFAATLAEHQQNARRFHQALNARRIKRAD